MSSAEAPKKMITLKSSGGDTFEVEALAVMESQTIKSMVEDGCAVTVIPLTTVSSRILAMVIEYCKRHVESDSKAEPDGTEEAANEKIELKKFDAAFVNVDQETLFGLLLAANYLDIKSLLDLTCQAVADMIKDKNPEEVRQMFNIKNDFTKEEEEEIRRETAWAYK